MWPKCEHGAVTSVPVGACVRGGRVSVEKEEEEEGGVEKIRQRE